MPKYNLILHDIIKTTKRCSNIVSFFSHRMNETIRSVAGMSDVDKNIDVQIIEF